MTDHVVWECTERLFIIVSDAVTEIIQYSNILTDSEIELNNIVVGVTPMENIFALTICKVEFLLELIL